MDNSSRLAFRALINALREGGHFGAMGMTVLVDELRLAAADARTALNLHDADTLDRLSADLAIPLGGQPFVQPIARGGGKPTR